MTVRIIVRVADYGNGSADHHTFKTIEVESPALEGLLRLDYGNRAHAEVIGAELIQPAQEPQQ